MAKGSMVQMRFKEHNCKDIDWIESILVAQNAIFLLLLVGGGEIHKYTNINTCVRTHPQENEHVPADVG